MLKRKVTSQEVIKKKENWASKCNHFGGRGGKLNGKYYDNRPQTWHLSVGENLLSLIWGCHSHFHWVTEVSWSIEQDSVGEAECSCSCGFLSFVLKRRSKMKQRHSEIHTSVSSRYKKWRVWSGDMEGRFSRVSLNSMHSIGQHWYTTKNICIHAFA